MRGFKKIFAGRRSRGQPSEAEKAVVEGNRLTHDSSIRTPIPAVFTERLSENAVNNQPDFDVRREVAPQAAGDLRKGQRRQVQTDVNTRGDTRASRSIIPQEIRSATLSTNDDAILRAKSSGNELIDLDAPEEHTFRASTAMDDCETSYREPSLIGTSGRLHDCVPATRKSSVTSTTSDASGHVFDDAPHIVRSYDSIPLLEQTKLPRGGISMDTKSVGRVQVCRGIT